MAESEEMLFLYKTPPQIINLCSLSYVLDVKENKTSTTILGMVPIDPRYPSLAQASTKSS